MKSTGIVRRVDELGRIVIPKELRKTMHINEGDSVEIFTNNDEVILKKFSLVESFKDNAQKYCDILTKEHNLNYVITDTINVICASGSLKKKLCNGEVSSDLLKCMKERSKSELSCEEVISIVKDDKSTYHEQYIITLISNGDLIGCLIAVAEDRDITDIEKAVTSTMANVIIKDLS